MEETKVERLAKIRIHRQTPIDDVIAEQTLITRNGDDRYEIVIQIGTPYFNGSEYACPSAVWGMYDRFPDFTGESSFHALYYAMRSISLMVPDYLHKFGAKVSFPGDEEETQFAVEDLFPEIKIRSEEESAKEFEGMRVRYEKQKQWLDDQIEADRGESH